VGCKTVQYFCYQGNKNPHTFRSDRQIASFGGCSNLELGQPNVFFSWLNTRSVLFQGPNYGVRAKSNQ